MPGVRDLDIARNWEPLCEALQQHVRIPLLRDHEEDWNTTAPESLGRSFANNGQISATDNKNVVQWYTLAYSCMHFDALNKLMNTSEFKQALSLQRGSDPHLLHIDFGCGPGTSAWASIKNFPNSVQLEMIGHDHNPNCTSLAKDMVHTISENTSDTISFDFLSEWSRFHRRVLRHATHHTTILVTVNSLFGQRSVSPSAKYLRDIIELIKQLRLNSPRAQFLIYGTHPPYPKDTVPSAWKKMREDIGAILIYDQKIGVESYNPVEFVHDIENSWNRWVPKPQLAHILMLPSAGGKR